MSLLLSRGGAGFLPDLKTSFCIQCPTTGCILRRLHCSPWMYFRQFVYTWLLWLPFEGRIPYLRSDDPWIGLVACSAPPIPVGFWQTIVQVSNVKGWASPFPVMAHSSGAIGASCMFRHLVSQVCKPAT